MSNNLIVERERSLVELERRIAELREVSAAQPLDMSSEIAALEEKYQLILRELFGTLSPWEKVHMARHPNRPTSLDYIGRFDRFDQLHGDRHFRDDPSIVGGLGTLLGRNVMVLGQQRGRDTKENLHRNFGMPAPEGYRKATRLARLASRLRLPIVTFVDTKGADPGISSEEHAQSEAIAICLQAFSTATVPIVATIVGEGGSGGALALAIADFVIMLEHSTYSVASPEGCAAILWSDASKAEEAAAHLKLTADDLHRFGIVDQILPEPLGGAHRNARRGRDADARRRRSGAFTPGGSDAGDALGPAISKIPSIGRMAGRRLRTSSNGALRRARPILRAAGRLLAAAVVLLLVVLVAVQYARAIGEDVAASRQLSAIRADIGSLRRQRDEQEREVRRLRDPEGAIPEIHDRLRLVRPNEALIFVSPQPAASP